MFSVSGLAGVTDITHVPNKQNACIFYDFFYADPGLWLVAATLLHSLGLNGLCWGIPTKTS